MAILFGQQAVNHSISTTALTVTTSATGGGDSLIAIISVVAVSGASPAVASVTGGGVTWTQGPTVSFGSGSFPGTFQIWYGHNSSGGSTSVSITSSGSGTLVNQANVSEWVGLYNGAPNATNTNSGTSTTPSTNSVTPLTTNSLVIAGMVSLSAYSSGPTNSFTRMTNDTDSATIFLEGAYQIESSAAAYSTGDTRSGSADWGAVIAAFGDVAPPSGNTSSGFFLLI